MFEALDLSRAFAGLVQYLVFLLALSVREAARAGVAGWVGDPTARGHGRTSLNPFRHVDPIGSSLVPLLAIAFGLPFVFGWARPMVVDWTKIQAPRAWRSLAVLLAGPIANLLLALVAVLGLAITLPQLGPQAAKVAENALLPTAASLADLGDASGFPIVFTLVRAALLSSVLAVGHLLPLPPFDGGRIAAMLMPPAWGERMVLLRPFGLMIVSLFALSGAIALLLVPMLFLLASVIHS